MLTRLLLLALVAVPVLAQEARKESPGTERGRYVYKLAYVIVENEAGKRVDSRDYNILAGNDYPGKLRIGTRVPLTYASPTGQPQLQYMDVGVNIDSSVRSRTDTALLLRTTLEFNSPVMGKEGSQAGPPTMRQWRTENEVMVPFGKPVTLFTMDEPGSRRSYQVQVTATQVQ